MKKILLLLAILLPVQIFAQIKNIDQLFALSKNSYVQIAAKFKNNYWKLHEQGPMDTLFYVRYIPATLDTANYNDMVMCYYKNPATIPVNYLVYQSLDLKFYNATMATLKKEGFKKMTTETKDDGSKNDIYMNDKQVFSIIYFKKSPQEKMTYIYGTSTKTIKK